MAKQLDTLKVDNTVVKQKRYYLTFRQNRSYELIMPNFYQRFEPAGRDGSTVIVDEWVILSRDFETERELFTIREVE